MMATIPATAPASHGHSAARNFLWVVVATMRSYYLQFASNVIRVLRGPLGAACSLAAIIIVYNISGQTSVDDSDVLGFLVAGNLAVYAWGATVWACGFGLQMEAFTGTLAAVFASPAHRLAVVVGYGLGNFVYSLPTVGVIVGIGLALVASFHIASVPLVLLALSGIYASALSIGVACAGLFILSRQANSLANFLQSPIYILGGFYFPRSVLPGPLEYVGLALPITHALDALRATLLDGAGWADVAAPLGWTLVGSVGFLLIGIWSMKRVDYALRTTGDLNLF